MKRSGSISALAALIILLCATLVLPAGSAPGHQFSAVSSATAAFSSLPAGVRAVMTVAARPPLPMRGPMISFMPNSNNCSVLDGGSNIICSILTGTGGGKCSISCDAGQICSILLSNPHQPDVFCSVGGRNRKGCSVLNPSAPGGGGDTGCSVTNFNTTTQARCSIVGPGQKQKCSADNPSAPGFLNICSVFGSQTGTTCSVLQGGPGAINFCSVRKPGNKACSAFGTPLDVCSIVVGQGGRCTSFNSAPAAACSAHSAGSRCSVIGGANGNPCP